MFNNTSCVAMIWSQNAADMVKSLFIICIIASIIHLCFWINLIAYSSVRQLSMQWLYVYLITDLLLLIRFFSLYAYRWSTLCIPYLLRTIICYWEAIIDNYLNLLQSYILLALNICRYLQVAHNRNVYSSKYHLIILAHFAIYLLPIVYYIIGILVGEFFLERPANNSCDLSFTSITNQIIFLLFSYFIPVSLTLIFLSLSLKYVRNTTGIRTQQIIDARLRYHRQILIQSIVFYSLWMLLWSPYLLIFPFYYRHSSVGTVAQALSYISLAVDPIVIAALDVRFLQAWHSTYNHFMRHIRAKRVIPIPETVMPNRGQL